MRNRGYACIRSTICKKSLEDYGEYKGEYWDDTAREGYNLWGMSYILISDMEPTGARELKQHIWSSGSFMLVSNFFRNPTRLCLQLPAILCPGLIHNFFLSSPLYSWKWLGCVIRNYWRRTFALLADRIPMHQVVSIIAINPEILACK